MFEVTPFMAFMFWLGMIYLLILCRVEPLQPDKPEDIFDDLDMTEPRYARAVREQDWWDDPVINIKLSGRWNK